jgi:peptide/nickel transport system substrate-binding protein
MSRTRRSWRRWGAALSALAVVATTATLGAAAAQAEGETSSEDVIFKVGIQQPVDSLNPFTGVTAVAYEMWQLMYDPLIGYDQNFRPQPLIATDVPEISEDGLTYTYDIREGIKWSDGEDLTADDVAYTFNRIMNGQVEKVNYGSYVKNITKVVAPDDTTVVMTTEKPSPLMDKLAVPILPEHIWKQIDEKEVSEFPNEPNTELGGVGSGPFIMTEAKTDQFWSFKSNPDYYLGAPKADGVSFQLYKNGQAEVLALESGEIDFYDEVDADLFPSLEEADGVTARSSVYYGFNYVTFNQGAKTVDGESVGDGHPALADPVVRQSIEIGMDKQTLVDRVLDGGGSQGTSFIPPLYADWHYEPEDPRSYDVDRANQMLDEAGYTVGDDGVRVMPPGSADPGRPLEFRLFGRQSSKSSQDTVEFMKTWLEAIGMKADVKIVSENFLYQVAADGQFDMYEWGWVVEPDPDYQVSVFTCGQLPYRNANGVLKAALNDSFYCNEEYDKLYLEQGVETDPAQRQEIVKQMQQKIFDDTSYIVTFYYDYLQAYNSDWTGFEAQPEPDGPILFQYGTFSYRNVELGGESNSSSSESSNTGVIIGGIALAAVVIGGVVFLVSRNKRQADDAE